MLKVTRSTLCATGYVPNVPSPYRVLTTDGPVFFRCPVEIAPQDDPRELPHATERHVLPGGGRFTPKGKS